MITYFLVFLFICNEVLKRYISENGLLFFQVVGAFSSSLFLLIKKDDFNLFNFYSQDSNQYFVVGLLVFLSFIKLYEIIALNRKKSEDITIPLVFLISFAHSNIYLKLFVMLLFLMKGIRRTKTCLELERMNVYLFTAGMFVSSHHVWNIYALSLIYLLVLGQILLGPVNFLAYLIISLLNLKLNLSYEILVLSYMVLWGNIILCLSDKNNLLGDNYIVLRKYINKLNFYKNSKQKFFFVSKSAGLK